MPKINLRDFYPYYSVDSFVDVPQDFIDLLKQWKREDKASVRKMYRHKAQYSLDFGDGIESQVLLVSCTPEDLYEKLLSKESLWNALRALPEKQSSRVYAHFFLGMSKAAIAKAEGVSSSTVRDSISHALINLRKYLKNIPF